MPDLYIYNGSKQYFDTTSSMQDLLLRRAVLVPPGSQALIQVPTQEEFDAAVTNLGKGGAMLHAAVADPVAFAGISHSPAPISIKGKPAPVVVAPTTKPAKGK